MVVTFNEGQICLYILMWFRMLFALSAINKKKTFNSIPKRQNGIEAQLVDLPPQSTKNPAKPHGICMFSLRLHRFHPGILVYSHTQKPCSW